MLICLSHTYGIASRLIVCTLTLEGTLALWRSMFLQAIHMLILFQILQRFSEMCFYSSLRVILFCVLTSGKLCILCSTTVLNETFYIIETICF